MQVLKRAQKCLLRGIFCQIRLTQHAIAQVENWSLIGFDEFGKRVVTALLGLNYPDLFFVHACSLVDFLPLFTQKIAESCAT
jgi:hypothetical protein